MMGVYHLIVNETKKEYLDWDEYNMSIKRWVFPKHGMILAWIIQYSEWQGDNIRMVSDAGEEDFYYEICENWKNRELDFVEGYNEFIEDSDELKQYMIYPRKTKEVKR